MPTDSDLIATMHVQATTFTVRRRGKPKSEGGEGATWHCSCGAPFSPPDYAPGPRPAWKPCHHMKALLSGRVTEDPTKRQIAPYVELTELGASILREWWAVRALSR